MKLINRDLAAQITINDPKASYTNGDRVSGSFIIASSGVISARYINVRLSNYSNPYVTIAYSNNRSSYCEPVRNLSLVRTVFPYTAEPKADSEQPLRSVAEQVATFNFEFDIPMSTQIPTISITCIRPSIVWCIEVEYCGKNSPTILAQEPIRICPAMEIRPYDPTMRSGHKNVTVDIPVLSGDGVTRLKGLLNRSLRETKQANVFLQVSVPTDGLIAGHSPPAIQVDFSSSDDSIVVKWFSLSLILKCFSTIDSRKGLQNSRHSLARIDKEMSVKLAINKIKEAINNTKMMGHMPGAYFNRHVKIRHKLETVLVVGSTTNPKFKSDIKLIMNVNVRFKQTISGFDEDSLKTEAAPSYEHAMVGDQLEDNRFDAAPDYTEIIAEKS